MLEYLLGAHLAQNAAGRSLAHDANHLAHRAKSKTEDLQNQVDRLSLFAMALAELLTERGGLTEEILLAKVQEIDLRDGRRDAKSDPNKPPQPCTSCGKMLAAYHVHCIYCGAVRANVSAANYLAR